MDSHYTNATDLMPKTPYTPHQETRLRKRHKRQQRPSVKSPGMLSPAAPRAIDQGETMKALILLVNNRTPASVIEHIVKLPPKCMNACMFLLQQVLDGADVESLTNAAKKLDPELADSTIANVEDSVTHHRPPSIHSHNSHQTSFSGNTLFSTASNPMNWSLMPTTINEMAHEPETYSQEVYSTHQNYNYANTQHDMLLENSYYTQSVPPPTTPTPQTSNTASLPALMASDEPVVPDGDTHGCEDYFDMTPFYDNSSSYPQVHGGQSKARPLSTQKDTPGTSLGQSPWSTTQHSISSKSPISGGFIRWCPPPAPTVDYRSPCPLCDSTWASRKEFTSHMKRNHDQPTLFICLHMRGSGQQPCGYKTYGSSQFQKHHTEIHRGCKLVQRDGGHLDEPTEYCRQLVHKARPKRVWGCWYCIEAMTDLDSWVRHHMQDHRGSTRRGISITCFISSLLYQPVLRDLWQQEIDQLEASTGRTWDLRWPSYDDKTEIADLVQDLETGFWDNQDFYVHPSARHGIVKAAMDATKFSRIDLGPVAWDKRPSTSSPAGTGSRKLKRALSLRRRPSKPTLHQDEPAMPDAAPHAAKEEPVVMKHASSTSGRANRGAKPGPLNPASIFGASYYEPGFIMP